MSYKIPVFLSYPKPFLKRQQEFVAAVQSYLELRGFIGRTLGVTDYDMQEPLTAIRRLIIGKWEGYSRTVVENKGKSPKLY
jgi:hypothetical protein